MTQIAGVITQTGEPGGDDRVYAVHVQRLREVLALPLVAREVVDSGGPEADAKLASALAMLRRVDEVNAPAASRDEDVLDGMIVELCRTAQFAAQSAAKEIGDAAIAGKFRLMKLSRSA